jgi:hypothetical protein
MLDKFDPAEPTGTATIKVDKKPIEYLLSWPERHSESHVLVRGVREHT